MIPNDEKEENVHNMNTLHLYELENIKSFIFKEMNSNVNLIHTFNER